MTKNQIIILSVSVFLAVIFWGLKTLTLEDEWVCENGKWEAHGKPKMEKPIVGCFKEDASSRNVSCQTNADCVCGLQKNRGVCEFGSRLFVSDSRACDDFCATLDGKRSGCVKGECAILE